MWPRRKIRSAPLFFSLWFLHHNPSSLAENVLLNFHSHSTTKFQLAYFAIRVLARAGSGEFSPPEHYTLNCNKYKSWTAWEVCYQKYAQKWLQLNRNCKSFFTKFKLKTIFSISLSHLSKYSNVGDIEADLIFKTIFYRNCIKTNITNQRNLAAKKLLRISELESSIRITKQYISCRTLISMKMKANSGWTTVSSLIKISVIHVY